MRCTLSWVTQSLMRAILNLHADRIWPAGRRFPTPASNKQHSLSESQRKQNYTCEVSIDFANADLNINFIFQVIFIDSEFYSTRSILLMLMQH